VFTLKGDTRQLKELQRKLAGVSAELLPVVSEQLAEESLNFAREGFDKSRDPYGAKWKSRKRTTRKNSGKALLVASGVMRKSLNVAANAAGFVLGFAQSYATFHQSGTKRMVQRMLVPTAAKGLPSKWAREFKAVVQDVFEELLGG